MSNRTRNAPETARSEFAPSPVNVRIKLSALWATMLFVFAYIDIFSFFRPDVRADIEAGAIAGFTIGPAFMLGTTIYILLPTLMVFATMVLRPQANRVANIALAAIYAATIVAGAIGEWGYYLLGSAVEVALLGGIVFYAWTWPRRAEAVSRSAREVASRPMHGPVDGRRFLGRDPEDVRKRSRSRAR